MKTFTYIRKAFFALALVGYVGITLLGLIHISHMSHTGMAMQDCPFALGEHSLCKMDDTEHIQAWQKFSIALLPTVKILAFISVIITLFAFSYHAPPFKYFLLYRRQEWLGIMSLFQQLFSKGILNPKAP